MSCRSHALHQLLLDLLGSLHKPCRHVQIGLLLGLLLHLLLDLLHLAGQLLRLAVVLCLLLLQAADLLCNLLAAVLMLRLLLHKRL